MSEASSHVYCPESTSFQKNATVMTNRRTGHANFTAVRVIRMRIAHPPPFQVVVPTRDRPMSCSWSHVRKFRASREIHSGNPFVYTAEVWTLRAASDWGAGLERDFTYVETHSGRGLPCGDTAGNPSSNSRSRRPSRCTGR